ncbi:cupin domain-containing protein [Sphingomonas sp. M1-B02]|uniref:cupin domain-containing protein n=1 Tax=Sphingomonas sp. M1-B02 TaxID=3114300 RepID=UPI00223FCFE3|nr:cupin domain-containing protein [Sphingomonas sp. S6-11]UZK66276.1 cupin domain-containing protein [Sphingomonas sp. S6-11]
MPKLDLDTIPQTNATGYPDPFDKAVAGRWYRRLAPPSGLSEMGVSHVTLKPGAWSSQRHWHAAEDEFVVMLAGEAVLIDDSGEHVMRAGDCAAFPKGVRNGHHLQNRGAVDCVFIAVSAGDKALDAGAYPDIDMTFGPEGYAHKDGTPYPTTRLP